MDRTVIYALVVGAVLIVGFFALWRSTGGHDVTTPTGSTAPSGASTGSGTGTSGSSGTGTAPSTSPPAK